ncbi:MAG: hypothetical protein PHP92_05070 [Candidatus Nanoarchaeia archaeon]|nr:hypothetical protein [Candidatus Nanoarchaeia archaeon]
MNDLIERLKKLEIGKKIKIKTENHFGSESINKVRYFGEIQEDGWIHESGAWCLYKIPGVVKKCYSAEFKPYKKKNKLYRIKIEFELKDFDIGW